MRRVTAAALLCLVCLVGMAGCKEEKTYRDGVYTAEFKDYDVYGYKDFLRATVQDGVITDLVYNAVDEEGNLKTDDENYQARMSLVNETYPKRYTQDLINQYMSAGDIDKVTTIAGATWSSDCFKALFAALEERMEAGDVTVILVDNIPEV